jgi:hypothetical protein
MCVRVSIVINSVTETTNFRRLFRDVTPELQNKLLLPSSGYILRFTATIGLLLGKASEFKLG